VRVRVTRDVGDGRGATIPNRRLVQSTKCG